MREYVEKTFEINGSISEIDAAVPGACTVCTPLRAMATYIIITGRLGLLAALFRDATGKAKGQLTDSRNSVSSDCNVYLVSIISKALLLRLPGIENADC